VHPSATLYTPTLPVSEQSGHTERTAHMQYAVRNSVLPLQSVPDILRFRAASMAWSMFLRIAAASKEAPAPAVRGVGEQKEEEALNPAAGVVESKEGERQTRAPLGASIHGESVSALSHQIALHAVDELRKTVGSSSNVDALPIHAVRPSLKTSVQHHHHQQLVQIRSCGARRTETRIQPGFLGA